MTRATPHWFKIMRGYGIPPKKGLGTRDACIQASTASMYYCPRNNYPEQTPPNYLCTMFTTSETPSAPTSRSCEDKGWPWYMHIPYISPSQNIYRINKSHPHTPIHRGVRFINKPGLLPPSSLRAPCRHNLMVLGLGRGIFRYIVELLRLHVGVTLKFPQCR